MVEGFCKQGRLGKLRSRVGLGFSNRARRPLGIGSGPNLMMMGLMSKGRIVALLVTLLVTLLATLASVTSAPFGQAFRGA